ncbi:uncharacterized protein [Antedon mediterranea]|uniref:uncharacterized protein n=1 Tax=Antedon mediterranea TaxID=105859 RepID=UPI003AF4E674
MADKQSTTRSGREYSGGDETDSDVESVQSIQPEQQAEESGPTSGHNPTGADSFSKDFLLLMQQQMQQQNIMMQQMMKQQERSRQEDNERRREDIEKQERLRKEDIEKQERLRKEDMERQERLRREDMEKQQALVMALMDKQKDSEEKRLKDIMRLKEVQIAKLSDSDDIENYLTTFERIANTYEWRKEHWVVKLIPHLTGKARAAYASLPVTESNQYDIVKKAILQRYDITEETYRQRFRSIKKKKQLIDIMPTGVQIWVKEHKPDSGLNAAELADNYFQARKGIDFEKKFQNRKHENRNNQEKTVKGTPEVDSKGNNNPPDNFHKSQSDARQPLVCRRCKKVGHIERFCRSKDGFLSTKTDTVSKPCTPYICRGLVEGCDCEILIDSGCDMTLVHSDLVAAKKINRAEQAKITCRCVHDHVQAYPTAFVNIKINNEDHNLLVGVCSDLPRDVILGRDFPKFGDLLGKRDKNHDRHSFVATRDHARKEKLREENELKSEKASGVISHQLDDVVNFQEEFGHLDGQLLSNNPPKEKVHKTRSEKRKVRKEFAKTKEAQSSQDSELDILDIGRDKIKDYQVKDRTLISLREQMLVQKDDDTIKIVCKDGILFRQVFTKHQTEPIEHLVVPYPCRNSVLKVSHDIPLAGHLGRKKTLDRIKQRFFWPGIRKDVTEYCNTCENCQKTSKYKTKLKAPMIPLPIISEPFRRIAMDIVGPLARSKTGNKYVLVICDYATRYPEAIPLRSIEAPKIADELIKLFSRVGVPTEILTDQGSNFTSKLLSQIYKLLSIKGLTTSPYHPQTDGLVERFNGTLKAMIRKFVQDDPREWDKLLPYLLFAYREVPQESTGFSPFELLYGWKVRGPLDIMKEMWTGTVTGPQSVVSHVVKMRDRLTSMKDLVQENIELSQTRQKQKYDQKSVCREFSPGDEVLLLLPSSNDALEAKWQGPYKVLRKLGPVNYEVETNDKRKKSKVYHINLLKQFHRRTIEVMLAINDVTGQDEGQDKDISWSNISSSNLTLDSGEGLDESQLSDLAEVFSEFDSVLQDKPGKTTVIKHDIEMNLGVHPVRLRAYPIPQAKLGKVKEEIESMLELGVIEESHSPWSSPYIMVPKPDGTARFCVNYKKVNSLSKFDAYPMPRIDEIIGRVGPAKFITKLDLCKGYWQVPLTERSKPYTAFSTPMGLYQFKYLPFGLHGAPATFQRMMDQLLRKKESYAAAYMDDLVIFSPDWESHIHHLRDIFQTLKQANLTVKPAKCSFAHSKVHYLGYVVGEGMIRPQKTKVEAVVQWEKPKTKKDVKSFLGLTGYYRKFIPNYADIAAPLTDLTGKKHPDKIKWTPECEDALVKLKQALCSDPVLRNPDFNAEFILQTDASDRGLGAVLSQLGPDGTDHPVLYLSRKMFPREQNYATIEKECLAIKWAVESLRYYLLGRKFKIVTDHQPLKWLVEMKETNKRLTRWSLDLQPYCFTVVHRRGISNGNADGLSRKPLT